MRIQHNSKSYTLKEYNVKDGLYITSNGIELKEDDIQAFIISLDEFKKIKYGRFTKVKNISKSEDEKIEFGEKEE